MDTLYLPILSVATGILLQLGISTCGKAAAQCLCQASEHDIELTAAWFNGRHLLDPELRTSAIIAIVLVSGLSQVGGVASVVSFQRKRRSVLLPELWVFATTAWSCHPHHDMGASLLEHRRR